MTYAGSGADYDALDPFKRLAQRPPKKALCTFRRWVDFFRK